MARGNPEEYLLAGAGAAAGFARYYIRPELTAKRTWAMIGVIAVAHELACPKDELLSEQWDRWLDGGRLTKLAALLGPPIVAAHLINKVPQKWDPLHQGLKAMKRL